MAVTTAFVAGATGYTGRHVVEELRRTGTRAFAHVRPDSGRLEEWRRRFTAIDAVTDTTPWDEAALAETLARTRPDAVFALLGTTRARGRSAPGDTYETVDYGLTAMLLRATLRGAPDARFVYLSSAGVTPHSRNAYLSVRWRLEEELRGAPIAWTIARPGFITGPDRDESRPLERTAAIVSDGLLGIAGALGARRLRNRWTSLTGAQLARALVHAANDALLANRTLKNDELRALAG